MGTPSTSRRSCASRCRGPCPCSSRTARSWSASTASGAEASSRRAVRAGSDSVASMTAREGPPQTALGHSEKNFKPSVVESDLYSWWERSGFFKPSDSEKTFVMMLPLPNITGDLHLGHALGFGGYEDLMARWHRMLGDATLYMPGTDHAGIIAQIVVEKHLAQKEIGRADLGREKFLGEMWKWMDHY